MARTGVWFQMARGRAIVRGRSMADARRWKRLLSAPTDRKRDALRDYQAKHKMDLLASSLSPEGLDAVIGSIMRNAIRRARDANRDWRYYRNLHVEQER